MNRSLVAFSAAVLSLTALTGCGDNSRSENEIGRVSTKFGWGLGDHFVRLERFEDPKISGVTCFATRAERGGIEGSLGLVEEVSDTDLACRQTGPIVFNAPIRQGEEVFSRTLSPLFRDLMTVRFYDEPTNTILYLTYARGLVDGSPKNSTSAVVVAPWPAVAEASELPRPQIAD